MTPSPDSCAAHDMPTIPDLSDGDVDGVMAKHNERAEAEQAALRKQFHDQIFVRERVADARKHANELFKADRLEEAAAAYERCLPLVADEIVQRIDVEVLSVRAGAAVEENAPPFDASFLPCTPHGE